MEGTHKYNIYTYTYTGAYVGTYDIYTYIDTYSYGRHTYIQSMYIYIIQKSPGRLQRNLNLHRIA